MAPKEEDFPVPCGFTEVFAIMAMSESEQMDTFYSLMESHISYESLVESVGGDFMSRMHLPIESAPESSIAIIAKDDITSALDSVHGNRNGHLGYRTTHLVLCKQVPQRLVADYIAECPVCVKKSISIVRTNNIDHHRKRIGLDGVTITPMDKTWHVLCLPHRRWIHRSVRR